MEKAVQSTHIVRFANFEVDLEAGELRKAGLKLKFSGQPFEVLAILLEQPGAIVTREQLQKRLWPDSFVDFDHNLNSAVNRIREALGDSAEYPRFVETLPRRGYRFIAPVEARFPAGAIKEIRIEKGNKSFLRTWLFRSLVLLAVIAISAAAGFVYKRFKVSTGPLPHALTRLTFDDGLNIGVTWSPDSRFIAYSSNRGGKLDIWMQQVAGGAAIQITKGPGNHSQPDWAPDGKYIAYRSEEGDGGIYVIPILGGSGSARKIASFGYHPHFSPDGSEILFDTHFDTMTDRRNRFYIVDLEGSTPREVVADLLSDRDVDLEKRAVSARWYPDGKRITVRTLSREPSPSIWAVPLNSGPATRLEIPPEVTLQLREVSRGDPFFEGRGESFAWAHSGTALLYEGSFQGVRNLWRLRIDPERWKAIAVERLTTGPGSDTEPSLSPDGKKVAFTTKTIDMGGWLFPFNATDGRITGKGQPITSSGSWAWRHSVSPDGKKLTFLRGRDQVQVWEKPLPNGPETPIVPADSYGRRMPLWSPDSTRLAYTRYKASSGEGQLMVWSTKSHSEQPVTTLRRPALLMYGWSPDGKWLLAAQSNTDTGRKEIWQIPLASSPAAETAGRRLLFRASHDLWQSHFSPDGRWIIFLDVANSPQQLESSIYAVSAAGGPWIRISETTAVADKPWWSPNGKVIYFISGRGGVFNVWGRRFDPAKGRPVGPEFRVTSFQSPGPMIPSFVIPNVELSLTEDKLILTMEQTSGSLWMLDNIDH